MKAASPQSEFKNAAEGAALPSQAEAAPTIQLPFPLAALNGASVAFFEHRNCEMLRQQGRFVATENTLAIQTTSLPDDPYLRIARAFPLTQEQANTIRPLPRGSAVTWECASVLSGASDP